MKGDARVNAQRLATGDGLAVSDEARLTMTGGMAAAELLVFDLV